MIKKRVTLIIAIILTTILLFLVYLPIGIANDEGIEAQAISEEWVDSNFIDPTSSDDSIGDKSIDTIVFKEKLYLASKVSVLDEEYNAVNKIYIQAYDGEKWENIGNPIISSAKTSLVEQISFCKIKEELYIFYSSEGLLEVSKLNTNNNTWSEVTTIKDVSTKFEIATDEVDTYITMINQNQTVAKIYEFDGTNLKEIITYKENDGYIGEPKVAILKGTAYISIKEAGKETISLYEYYKEKKQIIEVPDCEIRAFTYTMTVVSEKTKDKLYIAAVTTNEEDMVIYTYDGLAWEQIETGLQFEKHTPNMIVKEGDVYILALVVDGKLQTYIQNRNTNKFEKEGTDVDTSADMAQAIMYKDNVYTAYISTGNQEIKVKTKGYIRELLRGDINGDNRVSIADANLGAKWLVKLNPLTEKQIAAGDVNNDGRLSVADLTRISKFLAKIETEL